MIINVRGERFSPLQAFLILSLKSGEKSLSELLRLLKRRGLKSRSSFYTAVYELEKRGIISRGEFERSSTIKLTRRGSLIAEELPLKLREELYPILNILYFLIGSTEDTTSIDEIVEEPTSLIEYRDFLSRELRRVEERIKKWKKIKIE